MADEQHRRRDLLAAGALGGGLGLALLGGAPAQAAQMSATEQANLKLVNAFCAAWAKQDFALIMSFFSDSPSYRQSEAQPVSAGRQAVNDKIASFYKNVTEFKVHDSWVRGPMVVNERTDYFTGLSLKAWHGVGVFLVQNGKIVDWYDYTIDRVRT